jgi:transposase
LNEGCARKTFVERLTTALPFARKTQRVTDLVRLFGHAAGGRTSEKLLARLAMPVSDNAILRQLKRHSSERRDRAPLRAIAIDDWSWRKGFNYGTIIVDLERRIVADVLETRSAKETADWVKQHPEMKSSAATAAVFTHRAFGRERRKLDKSLIAFICCRTCAKASSDT